jgi:hypothetical protein
MSKAAMICITAIVASSAQAAVTTSNLLINPGAEEGNTTGWTKRGNIRAVRSFYETTGLVEEFSGEYFFAMGLGCHFGPSSISQRVDLSFLTAGTPAGFIAEGYVQTQLWPPMGASFDKGKLIVEFFDSSDNTLGQFILDPVEHPVLGSSAGGRDYSEFSLSDNIPAGTSHAVLTLEGRVVQGVNIDVYYDDLSFAVNLEAGIDRKVSVAGGPPSDSIKANLGDHITITMTVDNPYEYELKVEDILANEFKYIPGTFRINNEIVTPEISANTVSTLVPGGTSVITFDAQIVEAFAEQRQTAVTTETNLYNPAGEKLVTCASADITLHPYEGFSCGIERCTHDPWYEIPAETDVHWLLLIELWNTAGDQITAMKEITVHDIKVNEAPIYVLDPPPSSGTVVSDNKDDNSRVNITWNAGNLDEGDPPAQLWLEIYANLNADNLIGEYKLSSDAVVSFIDPETGLKLSAHTRPPTVTVVRE